MAALSVEELYERYIKPLDPADRERLAAKIRRDLTELGANVETPRRSIMELHGLGADIWRGIDAQEYVNELRSEWDHRP